MEVRFSPDKEARLQRAASRTGKLPVQLVEEAVDRLLESDAQFTESMDFELISAGCGGLMESEESGAYAFRFAAVGSRIIRS
jgi:hypothetical protein